jgi:uracil-DNA glycosylase family 4
MDWKYWGKPVPGFGDPQARVLVVGLAPGAHGSNRTGRMFTGDSSGDFLYPALYKAGFASQPDASSLDDGLELVGLFISALCRCVPPANKPKAQEIANCLPYLEREMDLLTGVEVIVALGRMAFDQTLRLLRQQGNSIPKLKFSHGELINLPGELPYLLASYHPSRQNTQTGRLTATMFADIWKKTRGLLDEN